MFEEQFIQSKNCVHRSARGLLSSSYVFLVCFMGASRYQKRVSVCVVKKSPFIIIIRKDTHKISHALPYYLCLLLIHFNMPAQYLSYCGGSSMCVDRELSRPIQLLVQHAMENDIKNFIPPYHNNFCIIYHLLSEFMHSYYCNMMM